MRTGPLFFWLFIPVLLSCGTTRNLDSTTSHAVLRTWNDLQLEEAYHVGFSLFDPAQHKWLFNRKENNAFTPGSNIKILTLLTALYELPEELTACYYVHRNDSLILWGGGDPGTFNPPDEDTAQFIRFIAEHPAKTIALSQSHFQTARYGKGWAWDDYEYAFQAERSSLPLYGNRLWIERTGDVIRVRPGLFKSFLEVKTAAKKSTGRTEWGERFWYAYDRSMEDDEATIPFAVYENDTRLILSDLTGRTILPSNAALMPTAKRINGHVRDTLLKRMMQTSDNFIAEQLLLAASAQRFQVMNEELMIDFMMNGKFARLRDRILWKDGSGLSRYNALTPAATVWLLGQILEEKGIAYIREIFPAGGVSGTIRDNYAGKDGKPYIFAKTGTLSQQHCLSGYLITHSGRILIFSWMHNQFKGDDDEVKRSMEELLSVIYRSY